MRRKKAMDMSWSMIGWMILALILLIIILVIVSKGTTPGLSAIDSLGGRY